MHCRCVHQGDLTALAKGHVDTWRAAYRGMMPAAVPMVHFSPSRN